MLLVTFATKSLSSVSTGVTRVALFALKPAIVLVKALIHRREVMRLGELDERSLKDIGLVRSDLDGALAVSWLSDPTLILAERSSARSSVAATRREASLQPPVTTSQAAKSQAAKSQPAVAARTSASKPVALQAEVVNSVACSA